MSAEMPLVLTPERRVVDQLYDHLRARIVAGSLSPGGRIVERALTSLGVSRTPIREALKRLEQDGLVVCLPHRGYRVRSASAEDGRRVYEVRRALEGLAGELAAERATPEDLNSMREALAAARSLLGTEDAHPMRTYTDSFHSRIAKASRNEFLVRELRWIWGYVHVLRGHAWKSPDRAETVQQQHEELLSALESQDPVESRRLNEEHVDDAWRAVAERFSRPV